MLSPDTRAVAVDLLRPPEGYTLDLAVLTTYTLDLDALLALPLAVLSQSDTGIEGLLADPMQLIQALREAGDHIHVFVDESGIAAPEQGRELFATLEPCIHAVRAPSHGVFHPKVWLARFITGTMNDAPLLRLAVLSRNMTFDRSWDVALASEAVSRGRNLPDNRPLGELLTALPSMASAAGAGLSRELCDELGRLAQQVRRTAFPAPSRFESPVRFHTFGLPTRARRSSVWPPIRGNAVLVVSPFVTSEGLGQLAQFGQEGQRTLISRPEQLDLVCDEELRKWSKVLVLSESTSESDHPATRASGLHAKLIAVEDRRRATWWLGSANATSAALKGKNVEAMAQLTGPRGSLGIAEFLDAGGQGFGRLCEEYVRSLDLDEDDVDSKALVDEARERVERARRAILDSEDLRIVCRPSNEAWRWSLEGTVDLPEEVKVSAWPLSCGEQQSHTFEADHVWVLPFTSLTAFAGFRLTTSLASVEDACFALKLRTDGMPTDRTSGILRSIIDTPDRFFQFLRWLLGGLDQPELLLQQGDGGSAREWGVGFGDETLLENLLRTAAREPARLEVVRKLVADLGQTDEGRFLPDDFVALWSAVDKAVQAK